MTLDLHTAFRIGAKKIAADSAKYTNLHKSHGIDEAQWNLLIQWEYWTPDQARQIRSILASVLEVSLTIAGMPAIPLPGQYVAALIAEVVAPPNRMIACMKSPDTFDGAVATGIEESFEVKPMEFQQLMALVIAYSGGYGGEPSQTKLPKDVKEIVRKENEK